MTGGPRLLVTGGAGFIGANLADRLASDGHEVVILDALKRPGVEENLAWLQRRHGTRIVPIRADIRDAAAVRDAVRGVEGVFHLAAQVAVTTSMLDPVEDFGINLAGTFGLLEAVRTRAGGPCPVIFASTNKVYGDFGDVAMEQHGEAWAPVESALRERGVPETRSLDFHTPYGVSKGAAEQYVLDWSRSFGVPGAVLRMSCIYGPRQMGTEDQGWVAHFLIRALKGEAISIFGDGRQVRDILHVEDAVAAWIAAWRRIGRVSGRAFNLGGGPANAVSLRQVLAEIEAIAGRRIALEFSDWRPGDQRWYVSDTRRVTAELGLRAPRPWRDGLRHLAGWLREERGLRAEADLVHP
jgi:CDP-paratose 2-epimerase